MDTEPKHRQSHHNGQEQAAEHDEDNVASLQPKVDGTWVGSKSAAVIRGIAQVSVTYLREKV